MATLTHDLQHHAKDKWELASALALGFTCELNPLGWQAYRRGPGNNSWRIHFPTTGTQWYFTGYDKGTIRARDSYRNADVKQRFVLRTRLDVLRFVAHVAAQTPKGTA